MEPANLIDGRRGAPAHGGLGAGWKKAVAVATFAGASVLVWVCLRGEGAGEGHSAGKDAFRGDSGLRGKDELPAGPHPDWHFAHAYPRQYVAQKLQQGEEIEIDGSLDDEAWVGVQPTNGDFLDIAQPLFPEFRLSQEYATKVKVRWDDDYLYVGAELGEPWVQPGAVTGSGASLESALPIVNSNVPYYDNDFEVFIDVSGTNYFYKEFEMNFNNATYDVVWRVPDQTVPCNKSATPQGDGLWCESTAWPQGGGSYSMAPRLRSATARGSKGWTAEIAFPLRESGGSGGLITGGADWDRFDPNKGTKFWMLNFARAEHPFVTPRADLFGPLCRSVKETNATLLGVDQWSCYFEWVWQPLGGFKYMHHPDQFGFLEFADEPQSDNACWNVQWPVRYILSQLYQAEIAFVKANGVYSNDVADLATSEYCRTENACNASDLAAAAAMASGQLDVAVDVENTRDDCLKYSAPRAVTGGPCFAARAVLKAPGLEVRGTIKEDRYLDVRTDGGPCLRHGRASA